MDFYGFYTGKIFDAYKYLGAHVEKIGGRKITESTYELNTSLLQEGFENRLRSLFNKGDNVDYISVNKDNDLYWKKIII